MDWEDLVAKKMAAPYKPQVKSGTDTSKFLTCPCCFPALDREVSYNRLTLVQLTLVGDPTLTHTHRQLRGVPGFRRAAACGQRGERPLCGLVEFLFENDHSRFNLVPKVWGVRVEGSSVVEVQCSRRTARMGAGCSVSKDEILYSVEYRCSDYSDIRPTM